MSEVSRMMSRTIGGTRWVDEGAESEVEELVVGSRRAATDLHVLSSVRKRSVSSNSRLNCRTRW